MMVSSVPTALRGSADIKKISKFIKTCRKQHGKVTFHGVNVICSIRSRYFVKKGEVVIASRYKKKKPFEFPELFR